MQSLQLVQICNFMQASRRGRRLRQQGGPRRRRRRRHHAARRPLASGPPRRHHPHRSRPPPLPSAPQRSITRLRLSSTALRAPYSPRMLPSCPAASGCWGWCPASSSEWWVCPLTTASPSSPCCKKVSGGLEPERAGCGPAKRSSCARHLLEQLALPRPEPRSCTSRRCFTRFIPCLPRAHTKHWRA